VVSGNVYAQAMNIGGINVETAHGLQSVSDTGNVTSNTLQFSNATTGFITTANAQIGRDLVVTGNATVSTDLTVSANATVTDTLTISEHLIASKEATVTGNLHVTTIRSDSNVVAEYTGPHNRPLRKYPEVAMTANDNSSTSGYSVVQSTQSTSSTETRKAWSLFNHVTSGGGGNTYHGDDGVTTNSISSPYNNADGTYQENPVESLGGANGTWLYIRLPKKISLDHVKLIARTGQPQRVPRSATFLGSNNGTNWENIFSFSDVSLLGDSSSDGHTYTYNVNSTVKYEYFGFVWEKIGTNYYVNIEELELYGHEEGSGSLDTTLKTVYNVPATTGTQLEVYYDAKGESTVQSPIPDLSPNTNTGAVSGHSPTLDTTGGIDSFKFNGSSQYVTGAHGLTTGTGPVHTISLWLNATEMTNYTYAVQLGQGGTSHQQSAIMFYENKISHAHWGSGVLSDITIAKNVWYHVVAVFTGGNGSDLSKHKIFINGEDGRVGPFPGSTDGPVVLTGTQLTLGRKENAGGTPGDYFNGSIANFRLYSKALNADQVKELYDYQKDYFFGSKSQLTIYKGHLGVGVTEPSGQLELAGDERVQEYPPRGMTGYETLVEGHGMFCAYASGEPISGSYHSYQAFNKIQASPWTENTWNTYNPSYSTSTGLPTRGTKLGSHSGEWLKLVLPYKIKVTSYQIQIYGSYYEYAPDSWVIVGSNDDNIWETIDSISGSGFTNSGTVVTKNYTVSSTRYYEYLALVCTKLDPQYSELNISELRYFGTPGPTTLDKGSLSLTRSLDVPRVSRYDVDTETPRPEKLLVDFDTTVNSSPTDISGKGNHGVFYNGASYSPADKAFKFVGVDNNGQAANSSDTVRGTHGLSGTRPVHSHSVWFKQTTDANDYTWVCAAGTASGQNQTAILLSGNSSYPNRITFDNYNGWVTSTVTAELNRWYHVVATFNGGTNFNTTNCRIYVDGVDCTGPASEVHNGTATFNLQGSILALGSTHNGTRGLTGLVSNYKLYDVVLEPSEVRKLYNLGRTGRSMVISDTAVGIGRAPEAQLDVRGVGKFETIGIGDAIVPGVVDSSISAPLDIIVKSKLHGQANWALDRSIAKFAYSNGTNKYGLSFSVSANNGDGFIQTFNESGGGAQYKLQLQPGGGITQTNGTNVSSDDRVKTGEAYIVNATETLMKLKPQTYTRYAAMLDKSHPDLDSWKKYEAGLITQEVYYDAPELRHIVSMSNDADVSGEDIKTSDVPSVDPDYTNWGSDISSLDYTQLIPYLIKSNQELYAEIQTLEHKDHTQELRAENNRLKNKVVILENRQTHFNTLLVDVIGRIEKLERPT
tara:strand:- start:358 stop:4338 length:3981 start_codon:yes stop_codon:yes gene_type:complete